MPGLSKKDTERLLDHIEPQGVRISPVKNGVMLRLPDGGTQVVHFSVSDHRGPQKLRARLKRAGVTWPTDALKEENRPRLEMKTREVAERAIERLGHPRSLKAAAMREEFHREGWDNVTNGTIRRVMLYLGYESHGKTIAQEWRLPTPIVIEETPKPSPQSQSNVTELYPTVPQATPDATEIETTEEETPTEIEIADATPEIPAETTTEIVPPIAEDDPYAWTIDLDGLPDGMTLLELRLIWAASGLDVEVRLRHRKTVPSSQTREDAI